MLAGRHVGQAVLAPFALDLEEGHLTANLFLDRVEADQGIEFALDHGQRAGFRRRLAIERSERRQHRSVFLESAPRRLSYLLPGLAKLLHELLRSFRHAPDAIGPSPE